MKLLVAGREIPDSRWREGAATSISLVDRCVSNGLTTHDQLLKLVLMWVEKRLGNPALDLLWLPVFRCCKLEANTRPSTRPGLKSLVFCLVEKISIL